jgi:hypothetical protein
VPDSPDSPGRPPAPAEPPDRRLAALLRRAVLEHALTERRRTHLPILHVGIPGQPHLLFAIAPDEPSDHALRADVVAAMRARQLRPAYRADVPERPGPADDRGGRAPGRAGRRRGDAEPAEAGEPILVWLTRSGPLELADIDVDWFAAARHAFAEAGAPLHFAVVNRHGWRDPATGSGRQWRRLRAS